jgi:hypothetical protein
MNIRNIVGKVKNIVKNFHFYSRFFFLFHFSLCAKSYKLKQNSILNLFKFIQVQSSQTKWLFWLNHGRTSWILLKEMEVFVFVLSSNILRFPDVNLVFFPAEDPRLKQWFMMSDPILSTSICVAYFIFVAVGPKLMQNREPFELRGLLIVYNFCMVFVSLYLFSEVSLF